MGKKVIMILRTKNGEAIGIPLTDTAIKTLSEVQRIRHLHSPYVFCDSNGKPYSLFRVSMSFKRTTERAKIENLRFHDLRYDFASGLVQSGVPIHTVKELLEHKDLRMTIRYSHLSPENLRDAVNVLDNREKCYVFATFEKEKRLANTLSSLYLGVPRGIRTPVIAVKGRCPGPG